MSKGTDVYTIGGGAIRLALALVAAVALGACGGGLGKGEIVVPDRPTAMEQAQVANRQFQVAGQSVDQKVRREEFEKAEAALQAVVTRFPNDRVYTPAAHLALAQSRVEMGRHGDAERTFAEVVRLYPDVPDVHAAALYGLAQAFRQQRKFRQEKETLRQFIDLYESNPDRAIASRVAAARRQYDEVQRK